MAGPISLPPLEILNLIDFWTTYLDKHELTTAPDYRIAVRSTLRVLQAMVITISDSEESRKLFTSLI